MEIVGSILILLSIISFIWTDVGVLMMGLFMLFDTSAPIIPQTEVGFWGGKSGKIIVRVTSLFFIGFGVFIISLG
ncbi:hypothetical protein [Clostridium lacusfryxellense]|uniref:hypothetical protein n=1 Tax=Clostridium lacusfryxellense TaxID=205328 RepID=UPI001C0D8258|nr:hypothetical protein [Clostridium lacusfryxellense]MBU3112686.1 hypothetical protein [Clostridium lacusfryxellense]